MNFRMILSVTIKSDFRQRVIQSSGNPFRKTRAVIGRGEQAETNTRLRHNYQFPGFHFLKTSSLAEIW